MQWPGGLIKDLHMNAVAVAATERSYNDGNTCLWGRASRAVDESRSTIPRNSRDPLPRKQEHAAGPASPRAPPGQ